jgi:small-conductance mechanosensitive channel
MRSIKRYKHDRGLHSIDSFLARASRWSFAVLWLASARSAQAAGTDLSAPARWLENTLATIAGDWIGEEAFAGIAWERLFVSGTVLLLATAAAAVLRWLLRSVAANHGAERSHRASLAAKPLPWLQLALQALIPPLCLFVWLWGAHAAFAFLFAARAQSEQGSSFILGLLSWLKNSGVVATLVWFIFRMIHVAEVSLRQWTATTESKWDDVVAALLVRASRLIVPLVGVILAMSALDLPASSDKLFRETASLVLIGAIGSIVYRLVNTAEDALLSQFRIDVKDNLQARKVYTQVKVLKNVAVAVVVVLTAASMLMAIDSVRQLGMSILASAGVLGIVVGFAAQRSIATLLAGFQIAITQPIRLDDVVIVENEWGRIEEISLTYVVVVIWDRRRLIVPITYFIEKPFQNWTRVSADLIGSVFLYVDYTVPLKALRDELDRLLDASKLWDGKVKVIQVTDAKENSMEVRVLVSAADAPTAWDLRCELREKLIDFVQRNNPQSLPRVRTEITGIHPTSTPEQA